MGGGRETGEYLVNGDVRGLSETHFFVSALHSAAHCFLGHGLAGRTHAAADVLWPSSPIGCLALDLDADLSRRLLAG